MGGGLDEGERPCVAGAAHSLGHAHEAGMQEYHRKIMFVICWVVFIENMYNRVLQNGDSIASWDISQIPF